MDYNFLILRFKGFFHSIQGEWEKISIENGLLEKKFFKHPINDFLLPFIGIAAISSFLYHIISSNDINLNVALTHGGFIYIALYFGIFSSSILMQKLIFPFFDLMETDISALQLSAYSSTIIVFAFIIAEFVPSYSSLLLLFGLLVYYPINVCSKKIFRFKSKYYSNLFTVCCTLVCFACPYFIRFMLITLSSKLTL